MSSADKAFAKRWTDANLAASAGPLQDGSQTPATGGSSPYPYSVFRVENAPLENRSNKSKSVRHLVSVRVHHSQKAQASAAGAAVFAAFDDQPLPMPSGVTGERVTLCHAVEAPVTSRVGDDQHVCRMTFEVLVQIDR